MKLSDNEFPKPETIPGVLLNEITFIKKLPDIVTVMLWRVQRETRKAALEWMINQDTGSYDSLQTLLYKVQEEINTL